MTNLPQSPQGISSQQAASELLARRQARRKLIRYVTYTFPQYVTDRMHNLIADDLDDVVDGKIKRLLIFAPPQSGKSQLVSVHFPAYWLSKRPNDPIILASYGADLAVDKGKQARDLVISPLHRNVFTDFTLRDGSQAAHFWKLGHGKGYMLSAGVGGPVTGHGAQLGIIDDPFENWEDAQSPTIRNKTWDWWRGTFRTRLWEGAAVIMICTRWHEDDLAGRLLKDQPGRWKVLRLPMIAETQSERDDNNRFLGLPVGEADPLGREPGEVLVPSRFSPEAVEEIRVEAGSRVFAAEYQGVPRPPEGDRVRRGWFKIVGEAPRDARRVRYWDKAGSDNSGDFTVGLLMAEKDGIYYIEDVVREQVSVHERKKLMLQTAILDATKYGKLRWHADIGIPELTDGTPIPILGDDFVVDDPGVAIFIEQEGGSGGKDSVKEDIAFLAGFNVRADSPVGDKLTRAEPWIAQAEAENIRLVRGPWNYAYLEEVVTVPNAAHDDQWDATSGAFKRLRKPRTTRLGSAVA